ncbi:MAG: hypothetical protein M1834_007527 [Cirrosporium novae-zelandiae]|nr:MAG: hypothetical protein M1834_007527 [Cirrosporium novae-zelandiae]
MSRPHSTLSRDDSASDRYSFELSVRSSQISRLEPIRIKRRFEDAAERLRGRGKLKALPTLSESVQARASEPGTSTTHENNLNQATPQGLPRREPQVVANGHTPLLPARTDDQFRNDDCSGLKKWSKHALRLTWIVLFSNYANLLLLLIPFAFVGRALCWPNEAVLILNGVIMLPFTLMVAIATEQLGTRLGLGFAGVLSYSFSNAGTIIVSCVLLNRGETLVVQTSLLGAIVFNLLAIMSCQYVAGGIAYSEQDFNSTVANVNGSVLPLSASSITLPAILRQVQGEESVVVVSRQLAISSLVIYVALLFFQSKTHASFYDPEGAWDSIIEERESELRMLSPPPAFILLIAATAMLTAATEFFVDALNDATAHHSISRTFIGFIFLPLVSNAMSYITEVRDAWKNKMDKASIMSIGCSIQIALFIIPVTVLVGWGIGKDMTL